MKCNRCGHPNVGKPWNSYSRPSPDIIGRHFPKCSRCHKGLAGETHSWEDKSTKQNLCCGCYCYYARQIKNEQ